jgi:hypothetical protein
MLPFILAAAISTSSIPSLDISAGCKPQSTFEGQAIDYKSCMREEQATKQKLVKEWASYPAAARRQCASDRSSLVNSYVELLTCIEMQTWKNEPGTMNPSGGEGAAAGGAKAGGGSPPLPAQMRGSSVSHPLGGRPGAHLP